MSLNRREMLRLGAAGAGGADAVVGGQPDDPAGAACSAPRRCLPPLPIAPPPAPVRDQSAAVRPRQGGARFASQWIRDRDFIGIVDFALASREPRFHVVHLPSGMSKAIGSPMAAAPTRLIRGYLEQFSNQSGSEATSNGAYMTADTYHGKYGLSMKVRGLDWSNNNAEARAIVIHNAWYAEPEVVAAPRQARPLAKAASPSAAPDQWQVMSRLGGGRLIYADKLA